MHNTTPSHRCVKAIAMTLLLLLGATGAAMAQSTTENTATTDDTKTKPYIYLSCTAYGNEEYPAFLNDRKFTEPQVIVYESAEQRTPITNRFYITYSIKNGTFHKAATAGEKDYWDDSSTSGTTTNAGTGTTVTSLYGDVETGSRPGTVTIVVTATPTSRYQNIFDTATGEYTITLSQETPTATIDLPAEWKARMGTTLALPSYKVTYTKSSNQHPEEGRVVDITNLFTLSAEDVTTAGTATATSPISSITANGIQLSSTTSGTAKVKFTLTPKAGYSEGFSTIAPIERTLTVTQEKIKPVLVFPEGGDSAYWATQGVKLLRPKVQDQWGNDITSLVSYTNSDSPLWMAWSIAPLADGKTMHTPQAYIYPIMQETGTQPLDGEGLVRGNDNDVPAIWNVDNMYVGGAVFKKGTTRNPYNPYDENNITGTAQRAPYTYKVYCQVYPKPHYDWDTSTDYTQLYDATESSYEMHVLTRQTQLLITPNPTTYDIGLNSKLSFVNRFRIRGVFTPVVDDPNGTASANADETVYLVYDNDPDFGSTVKKIVPANYSLKYKTGVAQMNNFPAETQHKTMDANGNVVTQGVDDQTYEVYYVSSGMTWQKEWSLQFLKNGNIPVEFGVYDSRADMYESPNQVAEARVSDQTTPIITVEPNPFILYTSDEELPSQPEIAITDVAGEDISSHYTITCTDLPNGITYADGKFSLNKSQLTKGDYTVKISVKAPDAVKTYAAGDATLHIIVKEQPATLQRFKWDVVDKQGSTKDNYTTYTDEEHGKLVITGAGVLSAGYTINAVPGLSVQFGRYDDALDDAANAWDAVTTGDEDGNKVVVYGDPVALDNDTHLPTGGTYYILYPRVNGFLTVDAKYAENNSVVLLPADNIGDAEVYTPQADEKGEHQFRYPLFAGTEYYLYNKGVSTATGSYTSEPLKLHGINFAPAFIRQRSDAAAQTRATAYAGSYSTELPTLTQRGSTVDEKLVDFGANGVFSATSTTSATIDDYVTVNKTTGAVSPKSQGTTGKFVASTITPSTSYSSITTEANRLTVYAIVGSAYKNSVVKLPYYNLLIDEVPTYVVRNLYTPIVGEEVGTTNFPTLMTAYFGGWQRADNRPYYDTKGNPLTDSWKTARMDSVGANGRTIDAFAYSSFGSQNAKSENTSISYTYSSTDEDLTYKVPCRGTYLRFEPRESGLLAVYIIQNGMVAYDGNKENASKSGNDKLKVNPVFITDETGAPVTLSAWQGGDQSKAREAATGAFTQGLIRCSYQDILDDCTTGGSINSGSEADAIALLKKVGYIPEGSASPSDDVARGAEEVVYDVARTLDENAVAGSKGYAVISKAYTRYAFNVKAGKTYFVFMNGSKLGNGGFAFVPDEWTATRNMESLTTIPTVCLDEKGTADSSLDEFLKTGSTVQAKKTCNVKLYHSFSPETWTAICLPVSVNETQFKKTFGDDAWAISLDSVADTETIDGVTYSNVVRLTQHSYHWLVAGRPYFLRPGANFQALTDETHNRQYVLLDSVTFEQPTTNQFTAAHWLMRDSTFSFRGFYEPTKLKAGDYFMGKTPDGTAQLYRATKELEVQGYRAFISLKEGSNARIGTFSIGDLDDDGQRTTTAIHDIFDDPHDNAATARSRQGVFNLQGQRVGNSVADLQHLPAGVYIVNGTKTVKQ